MIVDVKMLTIHTQKCQISPVAFSCQPTLSVLANWTRRLWTLRFKNTSQTCDKRYGLILTCLTTRAVHIEMYHNLTLDATMAALCRFFACRGQPHLLISDNGTNFTASEKEWLKLFHQPSLQDFFGQQKFDGSSTH